MLVSMSHANVNHVFLFILFFDTKAQQASAKAHKAVDHMANFMSSRDEISQLGFELPTSSLRVGYLSTIIQEFRVLSYHEPCVLGLYFHYSRFGS